MEPRTSNILHVVANLEIGGITRFIEWMVTLNGGSRARHDVLLGTSSPDVSVVPASIRERGTVRFLDPSRRSLSRSFAAMWRLAKEYDALFIHTAFPFAVLPLIVRRKPCLIFQHGMMPGRRSRWSRWVRQWWYSVLPLVLNGKVVCSTSEALRKMQGIGVSVRKKDVVIVPFGIPLSLKRAARTESTQPGTLTIGMAGRLVKQKRHDLVIRALAEYDGAMPVRLLLAGEGPLRHELEQLAASVRSNVTVTFLGVVHDMNSFYEQVDLVLFPSRNESFGLVVPEAFDRCVPVAVFGDVGGCLSLVRHRENGFIMRDGIEGLADLWSLLEREPAIIWTMSSNLEKTDLSRLSIATTRQELERLAAGLTR